MRYGIILLFLALSSLAGSHQAHAGEDGILIAQARAMVTEGDYEFARMSYRRILREYPLSPYAQEALFGQGEYDFLLHDYPLAKKNFQILTRRFPKSPQHIFALIYLWKIAQDENNLPAKQALTHEIVSFRQVSLVFRKSASYRFRSPLGRDHLIIFRIDKILVYLQGELFAEIDY